MATRILILADGDSAHTKKWALGLSKKGFTIGIFSFNQPHYDWYSEAGIVFLNLRAGHPKPTALLSKLGYLRFFRALKTQIKLFQPDVLHAHYASSYGLLGALTGFQPFILSVWGTDVMKFPKKSFIHKIILQFNLKCAHSICATSPTLVNYLTPLTRKSVAVVPFGVDTDIFKPSEHPVDNRVFTMCCAKALEPMYNNHQLILAFAHLKKKYPATAMRLIILGEGSQARYLKTLSTQLGVADCVLFTGKVSAWLVAWYIANSHLLLNVSAYESFGVNVLEAMACAKPVIVSEAEGLVDLVSQTNGNQIVNAANELEIADAMETILLNPTRGELAGQSGYELVNRQFTLQMSIAQMISIYDEVLAAHLLKMVLHKNRNPVLR